MSAPSPCTQVPEGSGQKLQQLLPLLEGNMELSGPVMALCYLPKILQTLLADCLGITLTPL